MGSNDPDLDAADQYEECDRCGLKFRWQLLELHQSEHCHGNRIASIADVLEPPPRADPERTSTFYFSGWMGVDAWRVLTPASWQTRAAAKKLARGPYKGLDFATHHLVIAMPWGFFRVLDDKGHVTPCGATDRPPV